MEFGLALPQGEKADLRRDVTTVAQGAEQAGYASVWVYERVLFPLQPADGVYRVPGLAWPDAYRFTAEPLTVLTFSAAVTSRVRLGTCVLVAPLHRSHLLARAFATLDQLSGGRAVAGFGSGWSTDEYRASEADFDQRGRALDETIAACRALWGPNPVTYSDSRMSVSDALVSPKPVGGIPILLGGGSSATALRRIARTADGWIPVGPAAGFADRWARIQELAASFGRDPGSVRLTPMAHLSVTPTDAGPDRAPYQGSVAQVVADLVPLAEIGADEVILSLRGVAPGEPMAEQAATLLGALTAAGVVG